MHLSRLVVRHFRNFKHIDVKIGPGVSCIVGENNTGKTNLLHALRLAVDARLPPTARELGAADFHAGVKFTEPEQIVVSAEFKEFLADESAAALFGQWQIENDHARITYRFRPKLGVRNDIATEDRDPKSLKIDDYRWELHGGGATDPATAAWDQDVGSTHVQFSDLQDLNVALLPPLRDVQAALRRAATSPLARLVEVLEMTEAEKDGIVKTISEANKQIEGNESVRKLGESVEKRFEDTSGPAFSLALKIGVAPSDFETISRSLTMLLSDDALKSFDVSQNGLGLNNVLYVSLLLEHFKRRGAARQVAGNLLLFEEPEAHVHPELQNSMYGSLRKSSIQTLFTTHSTHICSTAELDSYIVLTRNRGEPTSACVPGSVPNLTKPERNDIERYLDATRARLLFARRVLLVEGIAEQFLIPALAKSVLGIDLDRHGVAVVAIQGTHFDQFAKLFGENALPRRCAIVADGDFKPNAANCEESPLADDINPRATLNSSHVKTFVCWSTFERAVTTVGTLPMLAKVFEEIGAPTILKKTEEVIELAARKGENDAEAKAAIFKLRASVLSQAKGKKKGRFAQIASRHVTHATGVPEYIEKAIGYLVDE